MAPAIALILALAFTPVHADGVWLDQPLQQWSRPGMAVPAAPPRTTVDDPRCEAQARPPETPQDQQVTTAGWTLFAPYRGGWGLTIVSGLSGYDGMCRPFGYQFFVFVDGAFAGTISPLPMDSRTDGAGGLEEYFDGSGTLSGTFARYAPTDPLCCPSAQSTVEYRVERTTSGPVLVPASVQTAPTQR